MKEASSAREPKILRNAPPEGALLTPLPEPAGSGTRKRRGQSKPRRRTDSGESSTPLSGRASLAGGPRPYGMRHPSTDLPAVLRLTPRIAPGRSPSTPFSARPARGLGRCLFEPPRCAGKRADRPEGKSSRKTPTPSRPFAAWERPRGRRPAPDDWRPLREAIARGPTAATRRSLLPQSFLEYTRRSNQGNRTPVNPTLSRTDARVKELGDRRNRKIKQSRKFL